MPGVVLPCPASMIMRCFGVLLIRAMMVSGKAAGLCGRWPRFKVATLRFNAAKPRFKEAVGLGSKWLRHGSMGASARFNAAVGCGSRV